MAVRAMIPFLVGMMLLTGVCNTLLTKYQDMQCIRNCDSDDPKKRAHFEQPVIQTLQMFIGEMGCWLVIGAAELYKQWQKRRRGAGYEPVAEDGPSASDALINSDTLAGSSSPNPITKTLTARDEEGRLHMTGWQVVLLALPACCDIAGTTLMNVGLLFVAASIYQMTRGALVLFVGVFSVWFLKRTLGIWKWISLVIVVLGVALVGLAGAISRDDKARPQSIADGTETGQIAHLEMMNLSVRAALDMVVDNSTVAVQTVVGVLLIALAQIFTASQFVLEESIMERYSLEPLKAVGWEGIWGFLVTLIGMIILHFAYGRTDAGRYGYFDAREGLWEITHYRSIAVSSILIMISIGGFNFFGLSVTRTVSATSRSTIDTCRTLFIWVVSLGLGWETFKWLQVVGFALLVYGTFLFNDIVAPPLQSCLGRNKRTSEELLPETLGEHN
ncbi:hypothetical protein NA57DRAFT_34130 [Rhizodiscina lignyota]|uniref:Integral membrane protein n=1 Tax=Rhizodiscina lignyota TaxID=1504668 RepID=A0A9P4IMV0_9PEZI|nr:hypothetical protein NA57DRAFT_34130 [Rhizodiscina lignyota]